MVRRRDWRALIHYGVIFFMLEKLGAVGRGVKPAYLCGHARAVRWKTFSSPAAPLARCTRWPGRTRQRRTGQTCPHQTR